MRAEGVINKYRPGYVTEPSQGWKDPHDTMKGSAATAEAKSAKLQELISYHANHAMQNHSPDSADFLLIVV
jgi:hypothetical protein